MTGFFVVVVLWVFLRILSFHSDVSFQFANSAQLFWVEQMWPHLKQCVFLTGCNSKRRLAKYACYF